MLLDVIAGRPILDGLENATAQEALIVRVVRTDATL
jgi:hypothetical protein